jgi:hypothetical protein
VVGGAVVGAAVVGAAVVAGAAVVVVSVPELHDAANRARTTNWARIR